MSKGFSLIELLLSMSIIAVLAAGSIMLLRPGDYFARARDSRRISDLKVVQTALEVYYSSNPSYPSSVPFGSSWTPYLRAVPDDPETTKHYCYQYSSPSYVLCTNLEKSSGTSGTCIVGSTTTSFNYCISNPF